MIVAALCGAIRLPHSLESPPAKPAPERPARLELHRSAPSRGYPTVSGSLGGGVAGGRCSVGQVRAAALAPVALGWFLGRPEDYVRG